MQLFFSPWSETTTCLADMYNFSFGNLSTDADQPGLSLVDRDSSRGDPSYYLTAVITETDPSATDPDGCVLTPRAVGTITWDVPDTRPGLLAVDAGSRFGRRRHRYDRWLNAAPGFEPPLSSRIANGDRDKFDSQELALNQFLPPT